MTLMGILFPDSMPSHRKYDQNVSDCRHLVTCAREKITYFVTHDKALLLKGVDALNKIGLNIQIVSPEIPIKVLDVRETSGFKEAYFLPYGSWKYLRLDKIDNKFIPQVVNSFDHSLHQIISSGIEYSNRSDPRWKTQLLYLREMAVCGLLLDIPGQVGHLFRRKAATLSDLFRPLIPEQPGHPFSGFRNS